MVVLPQVRTFLIQRQIDSVPILANTKVPVLVSHGRCDNFALPAMADLITEHCKTAGASWYDGVGHAPFLAQPERFNRELASFARHCRKTGS
jgi:non-heme chloroperoxidase